MVMHLTLQQETRGVDFSGYQALPVLWQGLVEDYSHGLSFGIAGDSAEDYVSEAQAMISMPFELAQNILPISARPQSSNFQWRRARYAKIHDGNLQGRTWLTQGGSIEQLGGGMARVTLNLKSAMAWIKSYPSRNKTDGKDLVGTRTQLLQQVTASLSAGVPADGEPFKGLPIMPLDPNWAPYYNAAGGGYQAASQIDDKSILTIPAPYPLSIEDSLYEIMKGWNSGLGSYGLTLWEDTQAPAPMWHWAIWKRQPSSRMLTWAEIALYDLEFSNEFTDVLTYNEDNQLEHRYLGGATIANPNHNGAWLGVEFQGFTKAHPEKDAGKGVLPGGRPSRPNIGTIGNGKGGGLFGGGGGGFGGGRGSIGGGIGGGGGGFGGGGGSWANPGVDGNTVFPTPGGGFVSPGGGDVDIPVDNRNLMLLVNAGSGGAGYDIKIPFRQVLRENEPVPTHVFGCRIDGNDWGRFTITPAMVELDLNASIPKDGEDHTIEFFPDDGQYSPGWFCRFGYGGATGENKWLKMVMAMGSGCYTSPTGNAMAHNYQFNNCLELTSVANPDKLAVVTEVIPTNFHFKRFSRLPKIEAIPEDGVNMSQWKGKLPDKWKMYEIDYCPKVKTTPKQQEMPGITLIGDQAFSRWVNESRDCQIGALPIFEEAKSVGHSFMRGVNWNGKSIQLDRSIRNILPKAVTAGEYFMASLNGYNPTGTGSDSEYPFGFVPSSKSTLTNAYWPLLPAMESVGNWFLRCTYAYGRAGDTGEVVIDDMPKWKIKSMVSYWFFECFRQTAGIKETMKEAQLPNLLPISSTLAYRGMYGDVGTIIFYNPEVFPWTQANKPSTISELYRAGQYNGSKDKTTPKTNYIFLETESRTIMAGKTATYRGSGFANNGYTGASGQRVSFTDGREAIEGQDNLPTKSAFNGGFYNAS